MPLKPTTVRFASDAQILVATAASELGISVSQFIREAAIARAMLALAHEEAATVRTAILALMESQEAQRLARHKE